MSPAVSVVLFSILFPVKGWVTPSQPINIDVRADAPITLVLTDFTGKPLEARESTEITGHQQVDVKKIFQGLIFPGTYVLYAVPKDMDTSKFVGTPLVINVREDTRREATPGPMITRIEPLRYATIDTEKGQMTAIFYYDSAPATVENFIHLASDGFYDGLDFFRIVPGMLIETGDPRGDGTGGPGYHIEAEFNNRQHIEGVLSMARQIDPVEKPGILPRPEFANSAGSQFFICLDYRRHAVTRSPLHGFWNRRQWTGSHAGDRRFTRGRINRRCSYNADHCEENRNSCCDIAEQSVRGDVELCQAVDRAERWIGDVAGAEVDGG